jgi:hypothetical protein
VTSAVTADKCCVPWRLLALQVRRLVGCMQTAVVAAAARVPLCAVIHTALVPGSSDKAEAAAAAETQAEGSGSRLAGPHTRAGQQLPTFMLLTTPVPHELLLPQVDFCIHHGGAGTTQAALLAGEWQANAPGSWPACVCATA